MDAAMLRDAEPFDREFIGMMIPHHQGALSMAQVVLERGENPDVRQLPMRSSKRSRRRSIN
jgi:uncharacterized protein (DUF305 family)